MALSELRTALHALPAPEPPPALAGAVAAALDAADRRSDAPSWWGAWSLRTVIVSGLVVLLSTLIAMFWMRPPRPEDTLVAAVAEDFESVRDGRFTLAIASSSPIELERYLATSGLSFPVRVFDLAMMKQQLLGGAAAELRGRPAALIAYRGEDGALLVCRMFRGAREELPPPELTREHEGIVFQVYERGGQTLVFWQEGPVLCALAGDGPRDALLDLALAKAMKTT
jgi:hypothetical protein